MVRRASASRGSFALRGLPDEQDARGVPAEVLSASSASVGTIKVLAVSCSTTGRELKLLSPRTARRPRSGRRPRDLGQMRGTGSPRRVERVGDRVATSAQMLGGCGSGGTGDGSGAGVGGFGSGDGGEGPGRGPPGGT